MPPALVELGVGGVLVIQVLQIVLPYVNKRRNGNGHGDMPVEQRFRKLEDGQAKIVESLARIETCLAVIKDRDGRPSPGY